MRAWGVALSPGKVVGDRRAAMQVQSSGKETIDGIEYKLPFVDKLSIRIMKDEASRYTALRTGKLDMLQSITWNAHEELKKNAPQLQWARWLAHGGQYLRCAPTPSRLTTCGCAGR